MVTAQQPEPISDSIVYLARTDLEAMLETVQAIESVAARPEFKKRVFARTPAIAHHDWGPAGVFMGYDFHITDDGPKLIEINTNAGGAFLNHEAAQNVHYCCETASTHTQIAAPDDFEDAIIDMFVSEHRSQNEAKPLQTIAIVDENPQAEFLYPEFKLAAAILQKHGIDALVVEAAALKYHDNALWVGTKRIDLVYNRLVDFQLQAQSNAALKAAYQSGHVVLTPNPHNHAIHANKFNLTYLTNPEIHAELDLSRQIRNALARIPNTQPVSAHNANELWARRKQLFFKPFAGYGGKAVYRGDKITKKVWNHITRSEYIAQERAKPDERLINSDTGAALLKSDIRLYTYRGKLIIPAARLYAGQTTNFRTPGGGFAPIVLI